MLTANQPHIHILRIIGCAGVSFRAMDVSNRAILKCYSEWLYGKANFNVPFALRILAAIRMIPLESWTIEGLETAGWQPLAEQYVPGQFKVVVDDFASQTSKLSARDRLKIDPLA